MALGLGVVEIMLGCGFQIQACQAEGNMLNVLVVSVSFLLLLYDCTWQTRWVFWCERGCGASGVQLGFWHWCGGGCVKRFGLIFCGEGSQSVI